MLNNLEEKIIKKIKKENIRPLSSWVFIVKKILTYLIVTIFLLLAGLSLSVMFLIIIYGNWDIYELLGYSSNVFIIKAFPYFWLIAIFVFFGISLNKVKKIDGTYNYSFIYKGLVGGIIVILTAVIFFLSGISEKTETYLSSSHFYRQANYIRSSWENPERGLLSGTLKINNNNFTLKDFSNKEWVLVLPEESFTGKNLLINDEKIKLIGEMIEKNKFLIHEARTWRCACPHCARNEGICPKCSEKEFCSIESPCEGAR